MKKLVLILFAFAALDHAVAQEVVPPRFQGADVEYFVRRLTGEMEKLVDQTKTPVADLSPRVAVAFQIDTLGRLGEWRFIDNTSPGRDSCDVEPATQRSRELLTQAVGRLNDWTPAHKDDQAVPVTYRVIVRIPIEKIEKKQNPDPLLFLGEDPRESFHPWAKVRIRFDERFTSKGIEGVVRVRFYIEPDGRITIDEVTQSPNEKLAREVVRVIKNSKGKWTPRKVRGVPQRTSYEYKVNYLAN